jgi:hypothetical protein
MNEPGVRFTRFRAGAGPMPPGACAVPGNGMCLSTFLVLHPPGDRHRVLLGRIEPTAPWFELGGLDPTRVAENATTWLLPACQWRMFETPQESVERIAREMLESGLPPVTGPTVLSETMPRSSATSNDPHWDVNFLYEGEWPTSTPPTARLWRELEFRDVRRVRPEEFGRHHDDILAALGRAPSSEVPAAPDVSASERTRRP